MTTCFDPYGWVPNEYYRWDLYNRAIDSIRHTVWGDKRGCLVIHDDCSKRLFPPPELDIPVHFTRKTEKKGIQLNNTECITEACQYADWVLVFDSDAIVKPYWVEEAFKWIDRFKDNGQVAGFNIYGSKWHPVVEEKEDYYIKDSDGGCGFLFPAADFIPQKDHDAWEIAIHLMGRPSGRHYVVPKVPLMNHLGKYGYDHREERGLILEPIANDTHPDF